MNSPIRWFGGKGKLKKTIVLHLERISHQHYVEPFGGGASVLLAKRPAAMETYNDLDSGLYDFFSVMADTIAFWQFVMRVKFMPYSRELYNKARTSWQTEPDRIKRVALWYVVARQSFGGDFGNSWGSVVSSSCRGMTTTTSKWLSALDRLHPLHQRLQRVQIENADWRVILERYDTPDTLFYLDPPYIPDTRKDGGYACELTADDHRDLVERLLTLQGKAVLSGYNHSIYVPLEAAGWQRIDTRTTCHAAGRTRHTGIQGQGVALKMQSRTESLWIKPYDEQVRQLTLTI